VIWKKLAFAALCVALTSCNNAFLMLLDRNSGEITQSKFIVIFDKNGGDKEASPGRKTVTLPANTIGMLPFPPERNGYSFTGWNTNADGSGTIFNEATVVANNCIVFAQWLQD